MTHALKIGARFLLLMAALASWIGVDSTWATQPNVIVIMSDDAGYSDFGFAADVQGVSTSADTPNLDALAQQSVVLKQGYVAAPLCGTSRAGMLTGQYGQLYGYENNLSNTKDSVATSGSQGLAAGQVTIAQRLKGLGYSTGAIGKWHSGYQDGLNLPLDKGFDEFFGFFGGARQYFADSALPNSASSMRRGDALYETQWRNEGDVSEYDPANGRYVTDAFGEEAVSFINNHADEENPFFLYLAFNNPHTPYSVKQSDYDHFPNITNTTRRTLAALNYAMDRNIGKVMDALETNGVDDNTIVVFLNDNGQPANLSPMPPFKGWKGTAYEAGLRVPFLIKAPGLLPGVYNEPISALDILPTLYNAAGGDASTIPTDGYDVMPLLTGEQTEDPHEVMFWRNFGIWAVRKGDWKLTIPSTNPTGTVLYNIANDPGEQTNLYNSNLPIVDDLRREFTFWEATLAKPKWGDLGATNQNLFDHFVFRNNLAATANWSTASYWAQGGTANIATLKPTDAYANAIIEFGVRDDADYTATNDMKRISSRTFMLNQLRFTGDFNGVQGRSATINGNAVLFLKSLSGAAPQLRLDALSTGSAASFTYNLNIEVQLLDDLEITGNGTENFVIGGQIRDHYELLTNVPTMPRGIVKKGTSRVTFAGDNIFGGTLTIEGGQVILAGASAAINGAAGIVVGGAGAFTLTSGTVAVQTIDHSAPGGAFHFNGGTLKAVNVLGDLTNNGGIFAPGNSPAASKITGNYNQNSGSLQVEIGGTVRGSQYDTLQVGGEANLASMLEVQLINGFTPTVGQAFQILATGQGIDGTFAISTLPALPAGRFWNLMYGANTVILAVAPTSSLSTIPGDFNQDGTVDARDYSIWRDRLGTSSTQADGNFDGQVTSADYNIWKAHFGFTLTGDGGAGAIAQGVPEPSTCLLILAGAIVCELGRGRRRR